MLSPAIAAQDLRPPLGTVDLGSATVSGALAVADGRAVVRGGGSITARDRTAELQLNRGGVVEVCATSSLHITAGNDVTGPAPLLLALDRGAVEVRTPGNAHDVVITPDLRFSLAVPGPLDLHLRVTPNGDTCVENRGLQAPALDVINQFGDEHYLLRAGQHVLFEHGSLREVVDHESSPCGCPATPVVSVAAVPGTAVAPSPPPAHAPEGAARPGELTQPEAAASQHPFPAAESQGLAAEHPAAAVPQAPPGQPHAQVAATLAFGADTTPAGSEAPSAPTVSGGAPTAGTAPSATEGTAVPNNATRPPNGTPGATGPDPRNRVPATEPAPATTPASPAPAPPAPAVRAEAPPPPPAPPPRDVLHSIGHFFRRLFGRR